MPLRAKAMQVCTAQVRSVTKPECWITVCYVMQDAMEMQALSIHQALGMQPQDGKLWTMASLQQQAIRVHMTA